MINIGSEVHWMTVYQNGNSANYSRRDGVVKTITGHVATVRTKRGRMFEVQVSELREKGQQSELDQLMQGEQE